MTLEIKDAGFDFTLKSHSGNLKELQATAFCQKYK